MDTAERAPADRVSDADALLALVEQAAPAGFFALVALLERLLPAEARVGGAGPPSAEAIRFRHDPALSFSAGDVASVDRAKPPADPFEAAQAKPRFEVTTTFLGVTGSSTPLPLYLAEEVALEDPDRPLRRDFLDLFHHRLLSFLYRLVARYDASAEFVSGGADEWSKRILALGGTDAFGDVAPRLPSWRLLRLAPLLAARARNATTLEIALGDVLGRELDGARITVEEFTGTWVELEQPQLARLGVANHRLGQDLVLGERIHDRAGKFRIVFQSLTNRGYERLLPNGNLFPVVKEVVGRMLADPLAYELELVLAIGAVPPFALSSSSSGARLGETTWLGGRAHGETRVTVDVAS